MTSFVILANATENAQQTLAKDETGSIGLNGTLSVAADPALVITGTGTTVDNNGTIECTGGGRAIRFTSAVGSVLSGTINNIGAGSKITSTDDAMQIQNGSVGSGKLVIVNEGLISSATGQALDFDNTAGTFLADIDNSGSVTAGANEAIRIGANGEIDNSGTVTAGASDAIRIGGNGDIDNTGRINGGSDAANTNGADGIQFGDNATGTVINIDQGGFGLFGLISGDRHGINAGKDSSITVNNGDNAITMNGGTITGRNGSGVGSDGDAIVNNFGFITGSFTAGLDINPSPPGQPPADDGDGDGIDADGKLTLDNYGSISGIGAGGHGSDGLPNTSEGIAAGGGTIINRSGALITGVGLGILIDDSSQGNAPFVTEITNDGTIFATNSVAIRIISDKNDRIDNGATITGGAGVAIQFGSGANTLALRSGSAITGTSDGGAGNDTLDYSAFVGSGATVSLKTGAATGTDGILNFETVVGTQVTDSLEGSDGADTLDGGAGADNIDGGLGFDTAIVRGATGAIITLPNQNNNAGAAVGDFFTSIERFLLAGHDDSFTGDTAARSVRGSDGNDTLTGGDGADALDGDEDDDSISGGGGADRLFGDIGNDNISGSIGNDIIVGGAGGDTINGGGNFDTASFANALTGVTIDLIAPANNGGDAAGDSFTAIERYILSSFGDSFIGDNGGDLVLGLAGKDTVAADGGNDTVYGANDEDRLAGEDGDDKLFGQNGNDTLLGGAGSDVLAGDQGGDSMDGGLGYDIASYKAASAAVTVDLAIPANNAGDAAGDTLVDLERFFLSDLSDGFSGDGNANHVFGFGGADTIAAGGGNDVAYGGDHDDRLSGAAGDDVLQGQDGADTLSGGNDQDVLAGGLGSDSLDGGSGFDSASYNAATSAVTIDLGTPGNNAGEAIGDSFTSIERFYLSGKADTFLGDAGKNSVVGLGGNDTLDGGSGDDNLAGGAGADQFVFADGWGDDVINDFTDGSDKLDLSAVTGVNAIGDLTIKQAGPNTLVSFGSDTIILLAFTATNLTAADFAPF